MSDFAHPPGSDEEWEALLHQLRHHAQTQAPARPFLYARVRARLVASPPAARAWLPAWARRPAYVALLGVLGLLVSRDGAALRPAKVASHYGSALSQPAAPGAF